MDHITAIQTNPMKGYPVAATKTQNIDELADVVRKSAKSLSAGAVAALVAHPAAVSSALAATASTLGLKPARRDGAERIGGPPPATLDEAFASEQLDRHTRQARESGLLTSDQVAELAGLKSRQTVHDWLKKGRVIGWEGAKRGVVLPKGQFDERGRPLDGMSEVLAIFGDPYAAWVWLTTPLSALDGAKPLDGLRKGDVEIVVAAAKGDAQGDFA